MNHYQTLLDELMAGDESLTKSRPAVADRARPGAADDDLLAKAITVVDEDGEECMAFDAGELIKAFSEKVDAVSDELGKALKSTLNLVKSQAEKLATADETIEAQSELIKSLSTKVECLEKSPAGRRSVLNVHERQSDLAKGGQPEGIQPEALLAKAQTMAESGTIGWGDLSRLEAQVLRGPDHVDQRLLERVMGE